jgi:hypothetical protein
MVAAITLRAAIPYRHCASSRRSSSSVAAKGLRRGTTMTSGTRLPCARQAFADTPGCRTSYRYRSHVALILIFTSNTGLAGPHQSGVVHSLRSVLPCLCPDFCSYSRKGHTTLKAHHRPHVLLQVQQGARPRAAIATRVLCFFPRPPLEAAVQHLHLPARKPPATACRLPAHSCPRQRTCSWHTSTIRSCPEISTVVLLLQVSRTSFCSHPRNKICMTHVTYLYRGRGHFRPSPCKWLCFAIRLLQHLLTHQSQLLYLLKGSATPPHPC